MGSAASAVSEEEAKKLAGAKWDEAVFREAVAEDGSITATKWNELVDKYGAGNASIDWANREAVLAAVRADGRALRHASKALRADAGVVRAAVQWDASSLGVIESEFMPEGASVLSFASEELRDDRDVVLLAVGRYGDALQHASERLRGDRQVALAAVRDGGCSSGYTMEHVSEELKSDKELWAIQASFSYHTAGFVLESAPDAVRHDEGVVLAAVAAGNWSLGSGEDWSPRLRSMFDDKAFMLKCLERNPYALGFTSSAELKGDRDIWLQRVKREPDFREAPDAIKDDAEVVVAAMEQWPGALRIASEARRHDPLMWQAALKAQARALEKQDEDDCSPMSVTEGMPSAFWEDRAVVLLAMAQWGLALEDAPEALRADREVVLTAVRQNDQALWLAPASLQKDREVVHAVMLADPGLRAQWRAVNLALQKGQGASLQSAVDAISARRFCSMVFGFLVPGVDEYVEERQRLKEAEEEEEEE